MPVLSNPKHERFAQELAKGKSASEAYIAAGYKANDGNASTLKGNQKVLDRVEELQERLIAKVEAATVITIDSLTAMYLQDRAKAYELGQISVAKSAADSLGKLHGLVIDRTETGKPGDFARMTEDELDRFIAERKGTIGGGSTGERAKAITRAANRAGRLN